MFPDEEIYIDYVPKQKEGDYSTNLAFKIAARKNEEPMKVADWTAKKIEHPMIADIKIYPPGFINFIISNDYLVRNLTQDFEINIGKGKKILVEFVSANPTGPINIVSARAAAVGDSLVKLLKMTGFDAYAEYYVNDTGHQTELLAESVRVRMDQILGKEASIPEDGYHGEYLIDVAKLALTQKIDTVKEIKKFALNYFIKVHKTSLENFGVTFDNWVYESEIYKMGLIEQVLDKLNKKNLVYKKEGAHYFKATEYGDTEDRVIITSDGRNTYLLPDLAYHLGKIDRRYDQLINIWGPDHHGYIKRLTGGIVALGFPKDIIKVIIVQEVKLKKGNQYIKMSKRAGTFSTLDELLSTVSKDVARFFFLMRSCSQHLDFDLDLAIKQSEENPVYYVQYGHARIISILRFAKEKEIDYIGKFNSSLIKEKEEFDLIKQILRFPEIIEDAVKNMDPYPITYYLIDLAHAFHYFYQKHRVVSEDHVLTQARLFLVSRTADTIRKGLELLGVSCPERM